MKAPPKLLIIYLNETDLWQERIPFTKACFASSTNLGWLRLPFTLETPDMAVVRKLIPSDYSASLMIDPQL